MYLRRVHLQLQLRHNQPWAEELLLGTTQALLGYLCSDCYQRQWNIMNGLSVRVCVRGNVKWSPAVEGIGWGVLRGYFCYHHSHCNSSPFCNNVNTTINTIPHHYLHYQNQHHHYYKTGTCQCTPRPALPVAPVQLLPPCNHHHNTTPPALPDHKYKTPHHSSTDPATAIINILVITKNT